jgi:hypothetical protein
LLREKLINLLKERKKERNKTKLLREKLINLLTTKDFKQWQLFSLHPDEQSGYGAGSTP